MVQPNEGEGMSLRTRQSRFVKAVGYLIIHAHRLGYQLTLGDGYRDPRTWVDGKHPYSSRSSRHCQRLAIDFNVFRKQGKKWVYLTDGKDFKDLCDYWTSLGGISGISFDDGNHFEWPL